MWTDDEFEQHGGTYDLLVNVLQAFQRADADERKTALERIVGVCDDYLENLAWLSDDAENAPVTTVLQQATDLLASPAYRRQLDPALVGRFQAWAQSVTARRTPGPLARLENTYRHEFASHGQVGKQVTVDLYDDDYRKGNRERGEMSFADWLSSEEGRRALISRTIMNGELRNKHVLYLTEDQLPAYTMQVRGGLVYRGTAADEPFDSRAESHNAGYAIYVMDINNRVFLGFHNTGLFHHSSFLRGAPVKAAGKLLVCDGVIMGINAHSGHYTPSDQHTLSLLRQLLVRFNEQAVAPVADGREAVLDAYRANHAGSVSSQSVVGRIKVQSTPGGTWHAALDFLRSGGRVADLPTTTPPI